MDNEEMKRLLEKDMASLHAAMYVMQAVRQDLETIKGALESQEDDLK